MWEVPGRLWLSNKTSRAAVWSALGLRIRKVVKEMTTLCDVEQSSPPDSASCAELTDTASCAELTDTLSRVTRLCRGTRVSAAGLEEVTGLLTAVKEASRYLDGIKLSSIARIDQLQTQQAEASTDGRRPALPGKERTLADTLTSGGMQSQAQTGREIKQARAFSSYPLFGEAIEKGWLSDAYLDVLTSVIGSRLKERARQEEAELLAIALNEPVEHFKKAVRAWAIKQRPAHAEAEAKKNAAQESFSVFPDGNGYRLSGWLAGMNGTALRQALRDIVGVPAQNDHRHPKQRNAEALMGLVFGGSRAGGGAGSSFGAGSTAGEGMPDGSTPPKSTVARHEILVHVPLSTLAQTEKAIERGCQFLEEGAASHSGSQGRATDSTCTTTGGGLGRRGECLDQRERQEADLGGLLAVIRAGMDDAMLEGFAPATLPDGSSLAPSQLAELMCDSHITRLVVNARGEPLDVSRRQRLFSQRQAKAVIGRDRHCQFPGCSRGPEQGEIHHGQEWEKGGQTVIDNAVLLCFAHHDVIHRDQITIAHHMGGFVFTGRGGEEIGTSLTRASV